MPGSTRYLLDSNVIAKWFLQEDDSEKAVEIRDLFTERRLRLSTISLVRSELGNVLWKHPSITTETAREDFESLYQMAIPTLDIEDPEVLTRVFQTARDLKITFYDASYLTAAEASRAVLVTADEKLFRKLKGRKDTVLLRDWKGPARKRRPQSSRKKQEQSENR